MTVFPRVGSAGVKRLFGDTEGTGLGPDAVPVGFSYELPTGEGAYLRWGHQLGGNNCERGQFVAWYNAEIAAHDVAVVFHNATYDGRVLKAIGCDAAKNLDDTCVVAALLNEYEPSYRLDALAKAHLGPQHGKTTDELHEHVHHAFPECKKGQEPAFYWRAHGDVVEPYARQDARLVRLLWLALAPRLAEQELEAVYALERRLMPVLIRMYRAGVRVDVEKAQELRGQLLNEREASLAELTRLNGGPINPESSPQIAAMFKRLGLPTETTAVTERVSKRTGEKYMAGGNPSVTKDFLKTLDHPVAKTLLTARRTEHYANVFIDSYITKNLTPHQFIHPSFHQARSERGGARTGRFSSAGGLNAQNIPKRDSEWAPRIRGLFIPAYDGGQWLRSDYSQIEYRFFAHYAGGLIMQKYVADPDVDFHVMTQELILEHTGVDLGRTAAKNTNFGILFGMGRKKLARSTGLPMDKAEAALDAYHQTIPEARQLTQRAANKAEARGYIVTYGGRRVRFPKIDGRFAYGHKSLNYLTQGSAADLIKMAMVAVDEVIDWENALMHLTVHDELDFTVPGGEEGREWGRKIKAAMESVATLRVPVRCVTELGTDWGHCDEAL